MSCQFCQAFDCECNPLAKPFLKMLVCKHCDRKGIHGCVPPEWEPPHFNVCFECEYDWVNPEDVEAGFEIPREVVWQCFQCPHMCYDGPKKSKAIELSFDKYARCYNCGPHPDMISELPDGSLWRGSEEDKSEAKNLCLRWGHGFFGRYARKTTAKGRRQFIEYVHRNMPHVKRERNHEKELAE